MNLLRNLILIILSASHILFGFAMEEKPKIELKDKCLKAIIDQLIVKQEETPEYIHLMLESLPTELIESIHEKLFELICSKEKPFSFKLLGKFVNDNSIYEQTSRANTESFHEIQYSWDDSGNNFPTLCLNHEMKDAMTSNDGKYLAILYTLVPNYKHSCEDGTNIKIWDIQSGKLNTVLFLPAEQIISFEHTKLTIFNGDSLTVFTIGGQQDKINLPIDKTEARAYHRSAKIFPDNQHIALNYKEKFYIFDIVSREFIWQKEYSDEITKIVVNPIGKQILIIFRHNKPFLLDIDNKDYLKELKTNGNRLKIAEFTPNGKGVLISGYFNIYLFDCYTAELIHFLAKNVNVVNLCFSSDADYILGLSETKIYVWHRKTGQLAGIQEIPELHLTEKCLKFDTKNNFLILADEENAVYLYKVNYLKDLPLDKLIILARELQIIDQAALKLQD